MKLTDMDSGFRNDCYEYPTDLYCPRCEGDVDVVIEERIEVLVGEDKIIEEPYKIAVCPVCHSLLCERDRSYAVIRAAAKDGRI